MHDTLRRIAQIEITLITLHWLDCAERATSHVFWIVDTDPMPSEVPRSDCSVVTILTVQNSAEVSRVWGSGRGQALSHRWLQSGLHQLQWPPPSPEPSVIICNKQDEIRLACWRHTGPGPTERCQPGECRHRARHSAQNYIANYDPGSPQPSQHSPHWLATLLSILAQTHSMTEEQGASLDRNHVSTCRFLLGGVAPEVLRPLVSARRSRRIGHDGDTDTGHLVAPCRGWECESMSPGH